MKVPVIESADVPNHVTQRPIDNTYSNLDLRDGSDSLIRGVGDLAAGVGQVAAEHRELAKKAKDKADNIAADSLFTQAQAYTTQKLHGYDEAPKPDSGELTIEQINQVGEPGEHVAGYLDTVGTAAHEASGQTLEDIQKKYDSLLQAAGNPEQAALARQRMGTLFESVRSQVAQHEGTQFKVAEQAATRGLQATTLDTAANLYDKPKELAPFVDDALASLKRTAIPEEYEAKKGDYLSKVSQVMINGYLQHGDVVGAAARYGADEKLLGADGERVKAKIDEAAKAHLQSQKDIEGATAAKDAFDSSVDVKKGAGKVDGVGAYAAVDAVKARAKVDAMPEGPAKVAATHFLDHRLEVAKQEKQQAVYDVFNSALAAYQKTGTIAGVSAEDQTWLKNPNNKVGESDGWERLKSIARADADHHRGQPPTQDQQRAMTQFLVDLHDHPEKYATMTEPAFNEAVVPGLSRSDRERAGAAFAAAHSQAAKPGALTSDETKMLLQTGRSAGLFPDKQNDVSKWEDGQAELYYQASKDLTDWATAYRQQNGKAPPPEALKKQADELVLKGKIPGTGFFGYFQKEQTRLEAEVSGKPYEPTFSSEEKAAAAAALKGAGARFDDATVDTYLRRKHKLPAAPPQAGPAAAVAARPATSPETPTIPSGPAELPVDERSARAAAKREDAIAEPASVQAERAKKQASEKKAEEEKAAAHAEDERKAAIRRADRSR